ncbi:hypothetical protein AB0F93_03225 [Micromonospora tulbaghiae]|uniref:hypothetical protein n=1 Tax=Micromonospora TaxID=1873 RepID=UPI0008290233|nr:hypothetical protein [Micromonospora aurantiaca]SCL40067.1 hypothetical protein GA0070615_4262 [Micromonospora aurantiaca]
MIKRQHWPDGSSITEMADGVQIWHNGRGDFRQLGEPSALTAAAGVAIEREEGAMVQWAGSRMLAQIDAMADQRARELYRQRDRRSRAVLAEIDAMLQAAPKPSRWSFRAQGGIW